jgi:hypothetical protein
MEGLKAKLHQWRIEPREYARQEERRGKRHEFQHLVPNRTALVVIDMVPFFVAQNAYCRGIVPDIAKLANGLRAAGGTDCPRFGTTPSRFGRRILWRRYRGIVSVFRRQRSPERSDMAGMQGS